MVERLLWQLRDDPFFPAVDEQGVAYEKTAMQQALNPAIDPRVKTLYFDIYDWAQSPLLGGLTVGDGLANYPSPQLMVANPLLVLVSGGKQSGRDSLVNLIIHKMASESGRLAVVVNVPLDSRDKNRNVLTVATCLANALRFHRPALPEVALLTELQQDLATARADVDLGRNLMSAPLFQTLQFVAKDLDLDIVLRLTGGGDDASWGHIQDAVAGCCQAVIVMTSDEAYAKVCHASKVGQNVAWIRAEPLDEDKAILYIETRIGLQRLKNAPTGADAQLFPFTREAIKEMFRAGSVHSAGGVKHQVGWLRRVLYRAFTERARAVPQEFNAHDAQSLQALNPLQTMIEPVHVRNAGASIGEKATS
ncbi:hypothetical protein [Roseateles sp. P5_E4]